MAYIRWCLLAFFQYLVVGSFSLNVKDISLTRMQDLNVAIKVLNVAEELERETLPLQMGQRIYKIQGLKESAWYEVKISYPASIPASFSLELKKNLAEQKVPIGRRLLNTEKIIFKFDRNNWKSGKDEAFILVIVEPAGVVAKPNVQNEEYVMFNIICEELALGIPHRAWWVGIAALLCLLLAAVIPCYLPPQLLLRIQDTGCLVEGYTVTFYVRNSCPFDVWPAAAPNVGHPVIADGGFFLPSGEAKRIQAPASWSGRIWARTGCDFSSASKPACQTGDCQGLLSCNGTIGLPPATLVEVSIQGEMGKPSFYDVSLVDGYNLPVSVSARPTDPKCSIQGCKWSVNDKCPQELQVLDHKGGVIACKSACLAFNQDIFCCRGQYQSPQKCRPNVYSKLFKESCPFYFSYAYDTPTPLVSCSSRNYIITFCPSKWSGSQAM